MGICLPKKIVPRSLSELEIMGLVSHKMVKVVVLLLSLLEFISLGYGTTEILVLHPKYEEEEGGGSHRASFVTRDAYRFGRTLLADRSSALFPLKGNVVPDGLYYVTVNFGNPPQPYFLDVDSGSDLTWVQCDAPCSSCARGPHPLYKPRTAVLVNKRDPLCRALQATAGPKRQYRSASQQCDYEIEYADRGSSYGVLIRDFHRLALTNRSVVRSVAAFGCAYDQQGPLAKSPSATDGILGLGSGAVSLPSQWARQGIIKNMIGHCISGGGRDGGYMFFGDDLLPSGMTWVSMLGKPNIRNYYVGYAQMSMGNKVLDKGSDGRRLGGIIFDSGSSFTYFANQAYSILLSTIREVLHGKPLVLDSSDSTLPVCWRGRKRFRYITDVVPYFKSLVLSFGGTSFFSSRKYFEIAPEGYLVISKRGNACLGILNGTSVGIGNRNILGDISLQGYLVVYDNENNRIGWTRSDCRRIPSPSKHRRVLHSSEPLDDSDDEEFLTDENATDYQGSMSEETALCSEGIENSVCSSSYHLSPYPASSQKDCMGSI